MTIDSKPQRAPASTPAPTTAREAELLLALRLVKEDVRHAMGKAITAFVKHGYAARHGFEQGEAQAVFDFDQAMEEIRVATVSDKAAAANAVAVPKGVTLPLKIERNIANYRSGRTAVQIRDSDDSLIAIMNDVDAQARAEFIIAACHAYADKASAATICASCGEHRHTPLRIDAMGGYVCLTCIDQKLGSLLGEFGYPEADTRPAADAGGRELVGWQMLARPEVFYQTSHEPTDTSNFRPVYADRAPATSAAALSDAAAVIHVEDGQMVCIEVIGERVPTGRYELRLAKKAEGA